MLEYWYVIEGTQNILLLLLHAAFKIILDVKCEMGIKLKIKVSPLVKFFLMIQRH